MTAIRALSSVAPCIAVLTMFGCRSDREALGSSMGGGAADAPVAVLDDARNLQDTSSVPDRSPGEAGPERPRYGAGAYCNSSSRAAPCFDGERCLDAPCQQSSTPILCVCIAGVFTCQACGIPVPGQAGPVGIRDCPP